jgi:hypothetical protein
VDRAVFRKLLTEALGNRALTQTHIDFLWQCYDRWEAAAGLAAASVTAVLQLEAADDDSSPCRDVCW